MLELCYIICKAFGSGAELLYSGDDAYEGGKSDGLLGHRSSLEMKVGVQGSNLPNGVLFGNFPLIALKNIDLSGAMRLEDIVGFATVVVLDGSSSLEFEFAYMVLDMAQPILGFFLPVPSHNNMLHILASKEGQGFVGAWYLHFQKVDVRLQFDPGGRHNFAKDTNLKN